MRDMFEKQHELTQILFKAVEVMENAAKTTTDPETFKILTIGYNNIREELQNESGRRGNE